MVVPVPTPELLFWPGSLGRRGYDALLTAAQAGGFPRMAISPLTISDLLTSGIGAEQVLSQARDHGVTLTQLDGVASWAPSAGSAHTSSGLRARFAFSADQCLEMCTALGLDSILAAGVFDLGAHPLEVLVGSFGRFCDAAATRGIRVELEFVPIWGIPDLATAWEIVRRADRPNAGLLVDTWHLQKGSSNFEADLLLLESIPAGQLANLQLADATCSPEADALFDQNRFRRFPGDGELAVGRIARIIAAKGGLRRIGTEIFGRVIDDLSAEEAGRRSAAASRSVLALATDRLDRLS
jgi:sugar phosphate isomerase/epimerase